MEAVIIYAISYWHNVHEHILYFWFTLLCKFILNCVSEASLWITEQKYWSWRKSEEETFSRLFLA